jgi:hypothetical protein
MFSSICRFQESEMATVYSNLSRDTVFGPQDELRFLFLIENEGVCYILIAIKDSLLGHQIYHNI